MQARLDNRLAHVPNLDQNLIAIALLFSAGLHLSYHIANQPSSLGYFEGYATMLAIHLSQTFHFLSLFFITFPHTPAAKGRVRHVPSSVSELRDANAKH